MAWRQLDRAFGQHGVVQSVDTQPTSTAYRNSHSVRFVGPSDSNCCLCCFVPCVLVIRGTHPLGGARCHHPPEAPVRSPPPPAPAGCVHIGGIGTVPVGRVETGVLKVSHMHSKPAIPLAPAPAVRTKGVAGQPTVYVGREWIASPVKFVGTLSRLFLNPRFAELNPVLTEGERLLLSLCDGDLVPLATRLNPWLVPETVPGHQATLCVHQPEAVGQRGTQAAPDSDGRHSRPHRLGSRSHGSLPSRREAFPLCTLGPRAEPPRVGP
jgi:hypothetical protein